MHQNTCLTSPDVEKHLL
jgi:hypothetical protein